MHKPLILINGTFLTETLRGVQRYATEIIHAFLNRIHNYNIKIVAPKGKVWRKFPNIIQDLSPLTGAAWEQIRLPIIARKLKASILYCPCNRAPLLRIKPPLVLTIHDAAVFTGPGWFTKPFQIAYQRYFPRVGRISHRVVTCSNFAKSDLIKHGIVKKDQISVIYEGANHINHNHTGKNDSSDIRVRKLPINGKRYILNVGSRDPRKNVKRLCTAWKNIPDKVKKDRILVIAGGKYYNNFANEKISEIPRDVIFLGYIPDDFLFHLYKHADAFVFPSLYEGFGLPPLEAMACGTPVLVSHATSLPEVCGDAALYCDPYNTSDISNKLINLLTDDVIRERLKEKGMERATFFTWEKAASHLTAIFDEIIDDNG